MEEREPEGLRWRRVAVVAWALVGVALLVAGAFWLLGKVTAVLTPLLLSLVIVFVLRRPVARLEKRGLNRGSAVGVWYLVIIGFLIVSGLFIVPAIGRELREFADAFPRYYDSAYGLWLKGQDQYLAIQLPDWVREAIAASRESLVAWTTSVSKNIATTVVAIGAGALGFFVNIFLAFAFSFFVLRDLPTLRRELLSLPGPSRYEDTLSVVGQVSGVLEGFLRGQVLIAIGLGVVTGLGLWVLGVPYAAVIGLIAGVTNLVPYVGPVVGGLVAAISAAFVSPQLVLYTIIWILVVQQIESLVLQPRIMANQVHLHPALVILSVTVGATLAGIVGMLLAVPVAAVGKVLFVHYYEKWTQSTIASEHGALFRTPKAKGAAGSPVPDQPCETAEATEDETEQGEPLELG
jgi:predicted PurR-regulated permease PerM